MPWQQSADGQLVYTGTNLAGAEFSERNLPGTHKVDYLYPSTATVDYFIAKGMNTFRIPFRWERLQPQPNTALDAEELGRLRHLVEHATGQDANVILDPHNYARYYGRLIGSEKVPYSYFNDFWTRLSREFKDDDHIIFALMNEPNKMPTRQWRIAAQQAIDAIRDTGAKNLILVPGNAWSGAYCWLDDWYGASNAVEMSKITDPEDRFAFELHQYLNADSSGSTPGIVSPTVGKERLVEVTQWLRANQRKAFLGEFAAANATIGEGIGDEAIANMLGYMKENDDVWLGFTWWAAGPWWKEYRFSIQPIGLGTSQQEDRPALKTIEPFLATEDH